MTCSLNAELLLEQMALQLKSQLETKDASYQTLLVGIHTGGAWLSQRLHTMLGLQTPLGSLDISFYRDDFTQKGLNPAVKGSALPPEIEGSHIVLVDDVIMSGRTIRAALNELFDYGRPASVTLAVMVDIAARELPIQADICGKRIQLPPSERIKLSGPSPLQLHLINMQKKDNADATTS